MENNVLRIVSLNCCWQKNGFTDVKRNEILKLSPDILLVQECKQDDWLKLNYSDKNGHWYGDGKEAKGNPNKNIGIGIYCDKQFSIDPTLFINNDLSDMRYALPYIVKYQDNEILTLFSVWTKEGYKNFHEPIINSLEYFYEKTNSSIILIGDFNTGSIQGASNAHWYEDLYDTFAKKGFINCASGQEWVPTFFRGNKSWLDDHCFASSDFQEKVISFGIGNYDYWRKYSDHCPIIVDFTF